MNTAEAQGALNVNTAILLAAGNGSRDGRPALIRPNTLGEINMGDRGTTNAFDMLTADLGRSGIKNLIVVVNEEGFVRPDFNITEYQLRSWIEGRDALAAKFGEQGKKQAIIDEVLPRMHGIEEVRFVYQPAETYGNQKAVAAILDVLEESQLPNGYKPTAVAQAHPAEPFVRPIEAVCIVNGDGIYFNEDGTSEISGLIDLANAKQADGAVLTTEERNMTSGIYPYGIIRYDEQDPERLIEMIEKGNAAELQIPGDTIDANAGAYVLRLSHLVQPLWDYGTFTLAELYRPEYWITDVVGNMAQAGSYIVTKQAKNRLTDCSNSVYREAAAALLKPHFPLHPLYQK